MIFTPIGIIQSLWVGPSLMKTHQLSIKSFLKCGHTYHLYTYDKVDNVPEGAVIKDGNEILPASRIFRYGDAAEAGKGSYSGFSNVFRYELLRKKGGYWVDSDVVCLKKLKFALDYVFAAEIKYTGQPPWATSCLIKCPPNCPWINHCCEVCNNKNPDMLRWGEIGPDLVNETVQQFNLKKFVLPHTTICPINYFEIEKFFEPIPIDEDWKAVHLWNEMWSRKGYDRNATYSKDCLFEKLKALYEN